MILEDNIYVINGPPPPKPIPNISLGKLMYDSLLANPNKHEAMVNVLTGESISYQEIFEKSCSLAETLLRNGYGKNTRVCISSENNLQFYIPVISCLYIGATIVPINHNYTEYEAIHCLNISQPKVVFCSKVVYPKFANLKNTKLDFIEKLIIIDSNDHSEGYQTMENFILRSLHGIPRLRRFVVADIDPNKQIAFIMCSSGTTGLPKGVMQTHKNLMVRYMHTIDPAYTRPTENFLGVMPFFHGFGLVTNFFALVLGQKILVIKKFEEELFLKTIHDYRISSLWLAPPLVVLLAKSPLVNKYDLSCIKEITSASAPLRKETEEALEKRLKVNGIRQMYGLTEATLCFTILNIGDIRYGSSGQVATYMSVKIRDPETGRSLGPGVVGEICVKGPMVMAGYYGNERATRQTFTSDGWLLTGDLGYYDEGQYFYIVDRLKELIKYKGYQVAPAELEAVLLDHPKIKDVGVVGLPDDAAGELPTAFVVKRDNVHVSEKEVFDYVAGKVSPQKRLRGGVIFVSTIPKNPSGKILRRDLRKMLSNYQKAKL